MFSDLSECSAIEAENAEGVEITVYDSPDKDKYIKDLAYTNFYACTYSSAELQFHLFAYEFSDQATAQAYFANATGQDATRTPFYLDWRGLTTYERIVINNNLAYTVRAKASDRDAVIEIINRIFSEEIINVDW